MLKVAVISESSPFDRKGLFNAAHNRIKHLVTLGECKVDAFCVHSWDTDFTRKVRHTPYIKSKCDTYSLEGIEYRMLWYDFSIVDHILVEKLQRSSVFFKGFVKKVIHILSGYDAIVAHSFVGGLLALEAHERYGIPYLVTWHGSDIHTHPWRNSLIMRITRDVMQSASCNCFVSSALLRESEKILPGVRSKVLHNGVSEEFEKFSEQKREALREFYGLRSEDKVVAFVGSIVKVKNVLSLQPIFHKVRATYSGHLRFWMVGDGKIADQVRPIMEADSSIDVRFWGNVPSEEMPSVMNCIDVMVLPSFNEGLPLVCAEAIRCGSAVVGSRAGGIPEVIGEEYTVSLGEGFEDAMADKVVRILNEGALQSVPSDLDWKSAAREEMILLSECSRKS